MTRPRLFAAALATLAACGGAAPATTTPAGPTGGEDQGAGTAVALWAAVMKPGASFAFDAHLGEGPPTEEEPVLVQATVTEVREVDGGRAAFLAWTANDEPLAATNMPVVIVVATTGVSFFYSAEDFAEPYPALTFPPAAAPTKLPDGTFIDPAPGGLAGELCYGYGPADDAEECEDVCFSQLCVHPTHGLTGGEGKWWPSDYPFVRRAPGR